MTAPILCTEAGEGTIVVLAGRSVQAGVGAAVVFVLLAPVLYSEHLQKSKLDKLLQIKLC